MPRSIALLLLAGTIAATLVGCTPGSEQPRSIPTPTPTPTLVAEVESGEYRSISLSSAASGDFTAPTDRIDLTITSDGAGAGAGDFGFENGCFLQTGSFAFENGVLTITRIITLLSGCVAPAGAAGSFFSELLAEPVTVTRSGDTIMWTNPLGEAVFMEAP